MFIIAFVMCGSLQAEGLFLQLPFLNHLDPSTLEGGDELEQSVKRDREIKIKTALANFLSFMHSHIYVQPMSLLRVKVVR